MIDLPVFSGDSPLGRLPKDPIKEPMAMRVFASSITAREQSRMKKVRMMRKRETVIDKPTFEAMLSSEFFSLPLIGVTIL